MTTVLRDLVKTLVNKIEPDRIILFGSRANDGGEKHSDYDICVIKKGVTHRRNLAKKIYRLLYDLDAPLDVIVETPERFDYLKNNRFLIYKDIAEHGKVIYEK